MPIGVGLATIASIEVPTHIGNNDIGAVKNLKVLGSNDDWDFGL
jgi:hypothetical protein